MEILPLLVFTKLKNVISGEGGVLCINNDSMIKRAEIIREKGTNRSQFFRGQVDKYTWVDVGSSYLPGELISAFLYGQLECREEVLAKRLSAFSRYYNAFEKINDSRLVALPCVPPESKGNGHMFLFNTRQFRNKNRVYRVHERERCNDSISLYSFALFSSRG